MRCGQAYCWHIAILRQQKVIVPSTSKTWPEVISAVFHSDEAHRVHMGVCAATLLLLCEVSVELLMGKHVHVFSRYLYLKNCKC